MLDLRSAFSARAEAVIPGAAYNDYRRAEDGSAQAAGRLYFEALLPTDGAWPALSERVMPQLARYLQAKDLDVERPQGVLVALFLGESCYLLRAEELLRLYCELEGLNGQALHFRVLRWLNPD